MSDFDQAAEQILHDAARHGVDVASLNRFRAQLNAAVSAAKAPGVRLAEGYREATWGDPGYQPRSQNVVGYGKATEIDWQRSQIVMVRPRFVIYRHAAVPGQKLHPSQFQVIHQGQYLGSETEAPLIAREIFEKHVHEEQVEPVARRIDTIQLQMPDGALRVFRREGNQLAEKRVEQPKPSLIVRGLGALGT